VQSVRELYPRQNNLPVSRKDTIFCNFNKVDKVDPESFALWMAVRSLQSLHELRTADDDNPFVPGTASGAAIAPLAAGTHECRDSIR
jgi:hypothetical protein